MYQQLFSRVFVTDTRPALSSPVLMEAGNALLCSGVVLKLGSGTQIDVVLQESDDMENWTVRKTLASLVGRGYFLCTVESGLAARCARIQLSISTGEPIALVSAGVNISRQ